MASSDSPNGAHGAELPVVRPILATPGIRPSVPAGSKGLGAQETYDDVHLKDALGILRRRRWLLVGVAVFVMLLAVLRTFSRTPLYEATAMVRVESGSSNIVGGAELDRKVDSTRYYDTQFRLLRRRSLAASVLREVGLIEKFVERVRNAEPTWGEAITSTLQGLLGTGTLAGVQPSPEEMGENMAVDWMMRNLAIRPEANSELVNLVFTSPDPILASSIVNELARQYVAENIRNRSVAYGYASEFLSNELRSSQERLEAYEAQMREYSGGRDALALTQRSEIARRGMDDLAVSLAESDRNVLRLKTELERAKVTPELSQAVQANRQVQDLQLERNRAELDLRVMQFELGAENPELLKQRRRIDDINALYQDAVANAVKLLVSDYDLAVSTSEQTKSLYDVKSRYVTELEDSLLQYRIMAQQADSERETYQRLLDRSKEINIQKGLAVNNVQAVEPAVPPRVPTYPQVGRSMALGLVASILIGLGAVFFAEYMDRSIKTGDDLENFAGLPCLATIPNLGNKMVKLPNGREIPPPLLTANMPNSGTAEAFRYLRTAVIYSLAGRVPRVLVVSSSLPSEGKTTVTINLATAFAQRGARVLVIDGDLKRPACHKVFGVDRRLGLTAVLTGQARLEEVIFPTEVEGMDFMPAGPLAPNPADLIDSEPMRVTLADLRERYDHVFIDSAPLAGMADTFILSRLGDGLILVVESGRAPRDLIRRLASTLHGIDTHVLGAVLNQRGRGNRPATLGGFDYSYGHGYTYRYNYRADAPEIDTLGRGSIAASLGSSGASGSPGPIPSDKKKST